MSIVLFFCSRDGWYGFSWTNGSPSVYRCAVRTEHIEAMTLWRGFKQSWRRHTKSKDKGTDRIDARRSNLKNPRRTLASDPIPRSSPAPLPTRAFSACYGSEAKPDIRYVRCKPWSPYDGWLYCTTPGVDPPMIVHVGL